MKRFDIVADMIHYYVITYLTLFGVAMILLIDKLEGRSYEE
jgi:hypothetical protein